MGAKTIEQLKDDLAALKSTPFPKGRMRAIEQILSDVIDKVEEIEAALPEDEIAGGSD